MPAPSPSPRLPPPARDRALDGLRGLAALSVLGFHVWLYRTDGLPGPRVDVWSKIFFELNLGLICFFVLSGFLLYRPFARAALSGERRVSVRVYALRRGARIVPAYYACITGALLLYWALGARELIPTAGQISLFAVFAQSYSIQTVTAIDAVTWTLCIEVAFYVLLPLLALAAWRLGHRRVGRQAALLVALIALTMGWNALVYFEHWGPVAYKSLPAYLGDFAVGMLVALWSERRVVRARPGAPSRLSARATAASAGAGLAVVVATGYWHETWGSRTVGHGILTALPSALGFALLVAALSAGRGPIPAALGSRVPVAIGAISYGIYLWHIPLIQGEIALGWLPTNGLVRLVVVLAPTLAVATLSWRLIERPLIARAHRRTTRRRGWSAAEARVEHGSPTSARRPVAPSVRP